MKPTTYCKFLLIAMVASQVQAAPSIWDAAKEAHTGSKNITVYHDPNCGCCKDWIKHLKKHDFNVTDVPTGNMSAIKQQYNVPANMGSCHTAVIDGYVVEGHVPADDIKKLLKTRPDIVGLSVPQMPAGTPGMEQDGKKDPFAVMKFTKSGQIDSFSEYWTY